MQEHWHLRQDDVFAEEPDIWEDFAALAHRREIKKGEFIFYEGDTAENCYYLEKGVVKIFRLTLVGKEPIIFLRRSGELFGLSELMTEGERKCSAQAITACAYHIIAKRDFEILLRRHFPLVRQVMESMGRRLRYLGEQVENLMVWDVSTRVLKLLLYLGYDAMTATGDLEGPVTLPIRLSQAQLASMTGSCQQTISETLKHLQSEGYIALNKREITLVNPVGILERLYN